jgi:hypothetical protein
LFIRATAEDEELSADKFRQLTAKLAEAFPDDAEALGGVDKSPAAARE